MVRLASTLLFVALLMGCGTTVSEKKEIIPESEKSMKEVYDEHGLASAANNQNTGRKVISRPATAYEMSADAYRVNQVNNRPKFRKLPNPTLYIYFAPTLSKDGRMPIPAWMTEFQMFDRDEYALSGEINLGDRQ
ncbi:hypothetical protein ACPV5U_24400 [Vibrio mediterranei]